MIEIIITAIYLLVTLVFLWLVIKSKRDLDLSNKKLKELEKEEEELEKQININNSNINNKLIEKLSSNTTDTNLDSPEDKITYCSKLIINLTMRDPIVIVQESNLEDFEEEIVKSLMDWYCYEADNKKLYLLELNNGSIALNRDYIISIYFYKKTLKL